MNLADQQEVRRVKVWSGASRIAHGAMALSVLCLLATGWALGSHLAQEPERMLSIHRIAGYGLATALLLRFYLLIFGSGAEHWRDLVPRGPQWRAGRDVMMFYVTGGRSPLPPYYAHNPLWGPVYMGLFVILTLQILSGVMLANPAIEFLVRQALPWAQAPLLMQFHRVANAIVLAFTVLHLASVLLQDLKGTGCDISAMVNGVRVFVIDRNKLHRSADGHAVPLAAIKKTGSPR
jgi:Ni/Fe-hydrogenase 1 B-type cytochrome subunit